MSGGWPKGEGAAGAMMRAVDSTVAGGEGELGGLANVCGEDARARGPAARSFECARTRHNLRTGCPRAASTTGARNDELCVGLVVAHEAWRAAT